MPSDSETIKHMARGIAQSEGCHADDWRHFTEQAQAALDAQRAMGLVLVDAEVLRLACGECPKSLPARRKLLAAAQGEVK